MCWTTFLYSTIPDTTILSRATLPAPLNQLPVLLRLESSWNHVSLYVMYYYTGGLVPPTGHESTRPPTGRVLGHTCRRRRMIKPDASDSLRVIRWRCVRVGIPQLTGQSLIAVWTFARHWAKHQGSTHTLQGVSLCGDYCICSQQRPRHV